MWRLALTASLAASLAMAQGVWPSQSYKTETFLAPNLTIEKLGDTAPGYLFFGPTGNGSATNAPLIMTDDNDLVWHGPEIATMNPQNFLVQPNTNGKYISYWDGFGAVKATYGHGLGQVHVLDNTYTEIHTICPQLNLFYVNYTTMPCMIDNHESYITDHGTIIVTAYNVTTADLTSVGGPSTGYVFDALFYELDLATQAIVFRWSALEHLAKLPFTDSNYPLTVGGVTYGSSASTPWDYFHINSVVPLDQGYLVNSRYYWTTFKVHKGGNVDWRLEGSNGRDFTLDPGIFFSFEHMPRVISGSDKGGKTLGLTLFNNDNGGVVNGTNSTTGLQLSLDFATMHVSKIRQLQDSADPVFSAAQGSYQDLGAANDDHVLLGYGNVPKIKEYDADNNVVMRVQFGSIALAPSPVTGYRSYRQEWHATPKYPPKAVATRTNRQTTVYMSWNGATDYDGWTIYAGQKKGKLSKVAKVARAGFETMQVLPIGYKFVVVQADEGRKGLRNSTVVTASMSS